MDNLEEKNQENYRVQKAILAYLNAKPDNRATSKELIEHVDCQASVLCENIDLLNKQGLIEGPVFTEELVERGGDNRFGLSTRLTDSGQEHFVAMIKDEQS